jgi:hypothetical protein
MSRRYLKHGTKLTIHIVGNVGPSGTLFDVIPDATATASYSGNNPESIWEGVGSMTNYGVTYDVFVEAETGRLWFDNDNGY